MSQRLYIIWWWNCIKACVNKPANLVLFLDDSLPIQQYHQDLSLVTDLVTRLSRSIGRSHKFKLLPNWFQGSVLTFGNVKDFLKGVSRTNVPQRWSSTENIVEIDLKPGFLNIAVVIGANSMKRLNQSLDRDAPLTYILGLYCQFL